MTTRPLRIALDAMGGDLGPGEVIRGAVSAARGRKEDLHIILVGDEEVLRAEVAGHSPDRLTLCIRHASQVISMDDKPREAYKKKPDSSVVVAARLVREGEADAFISIGNTGAAMAAAVFL